MSAGTSPPRAFPKIDIIIPVKNEAANLSPLMARLDTSLRTAHIKYQAIIVDDHSTDDTRVIAKKLAQKYPIKVLTKKGKPGKAYSILEGAKAATSEWLVMIDGDLQYPPEAIPDMVKLIDQHGVVVARRISYEGSRLRRLGSRAVAWFTGQFLHGIKVDVQSGLKIFKKDFLNYLPENEVTPWALDLPLLHAALELGYTLGEVEITFEKRIHGSSKLSLLKPTFEIGMAAVKLKLRSSQPIPIPAHSHQNMIGAGLIHRRRQFITHSTLHHRQTALHTITRNQRRLILAILASVAVGIFLNPLETAIVVVAFLSFVYFVDVIFNFFLILKSLHSPPELEFSTTEISELNDKDLPIYTILCPLYKEAHILPGFVAAMEKLDWPKHKLDVILLFEEDDLETIETVKTMKLPKHFRVAIVPDSQPKTKPKACNYGLNLAKGEYVVIYDAEDIPEPAQLKKAYLGFQTVGPKVKCLQAKLNYYNPNQNWLTRFFTAEYSLWFDVILTGLQSIETNIPLGGTSNHFRTTDLLALQGWDPFNVTEDCDLGIRLFKAGNKTAIIDSTTLEEANSNFKNWIRQRSRWIKGYMQTYLIHMRQPQEFVRTQGWHALLFQLTIGGKLAFILINPLLWVLTISYFALYAYVGPTIEALYPSVVFYMAVTSLIFGNFMFIYYYMIGCAKREHWGLIKWVYLIPFYWLMVSIAGAIALYQLIVKPHYWEKTVHGLHLKKASLAKKASKVAKKTTHQVMVEAIAQEKPSITGRLHIFGYSDFKNKWLERLELKHKYVSLKRLVHQLLFGEYRGGLWLVLATVIANFLNMLTSFYLGHELEFSDFALINTFISLLYLLGILTSSLSATVNHRAALLLGKFKQKSARNFWTHVQKRAVIVAILMSLLWLVNIPWLTNFFNMSTPLPLIIFTPLIFSGLLGAVNEGYLRGRLLFEVLAITTLIDPVVRLGLSLLFDAVNLEYYMYVPVMISAITATVIGGWYAAKGDTGVKIIKEFRLSLPFFNTALISKLSAIAFFSLDNVIVAHYLSTEETGMYGLLGLIGKMIFFAGSLTVGFILPLVSHKEGQHQKSEAIFHKLLLLTVSLSSLAYIALGLVLPSIAPYFFGLKLNAIRGYLPLYALGILLYTISQTVVQYRLAKRSYFFSIASFLVAIIQVAGLTIYHNSLTQIVNVMFVSGLLNAVVLFSLHHWYHKIEAPLSNVRDFLDLFNPIPRLTRPLETKDHYRILILNWRDTKHAWAGGAEKYIHEVATRLAAAGHKVTMFTGNDGHHPRNEVVDGVQVVRRGGFYTVYIWAFLYYVLRFRPYVDIVIDCENGIPFLTPLYVRKPILLLIHHIHQEVFMTHLRFPFSEIAAMIESDLMPFLYKHKTLITVSESSKDEMIGLGLGNTQTVKVVNPGIDTHLFTKKRKTSQPSLVYLGRLKPYKQIDVAIKAFAKVIADHPTATFTIAGSGESLESLQQLCQKLGLTSHVTFKPSVTDEEKAKLFAESWVAVQPSTIEGWGITVIEANAAGTPVVASNVKGLRDSVVDGKTGILVKAGQVSEFAAAISKLFSNTKFRASLSREAVNWAKHFDWNVSYNNFNHILDETIQKHQAHHNNAYSKEVYDQKITR